MGLIIKKLRIAIEGLDDISHHRCNPTYDAVCMEKARKTLDKMKTTEISSCFERNHDGLERLIHNIGMGSQVFPDPELGQDVAMLAMIIQGFFDSVSERKANALAACTKMREIVKSVQSTTKEINSLKVYKGKSQ